MSNHLPYRADLVKASLTCERAFKQKKKKKRKKEDKVKVCSRCSMIKSFADLRAYHY